MAFAAGDSVHVRSIGKGIVREVRNGGRLLVEVNGRSIVTNENEVSAISPAKRRTVSSPVRRSAHVYEPQSEASLPLDLHGLTVDEAHEAVIAFLDRALLAGTAEARIIHGRSGGRLKSALHSQLKTIPAVRGFVVDARNPGVTIVRL